MNVNRGRLDFSQNNFFFQSRHFESQPKIVALNFAFILFLWVSNFFHLASSMDAAAVEIKRNGKRKRKESNASNVLCKYTKSSDAAYSNIRSYEISFQCTFHR